MSTENQFDAQFDTSRSIGIERSYTAFKQNIQLFLCVAIPTRKAEILAEDVREYRVEVSCVSIASMAKERLVRQRLSTSRSKRWQEWKKVDTAVTYSQEKCWHKSEKLNVKVIETRTTVLGKEFPDTLTSIICLFVTYSHQGQLEKAKKLETKTIKRVLKKEYPNTLVMIHNLVSTYLAQERLDRAEKLRFQSGERIESAVPEVFVQLSSMTYLAYRYWPKLDSLPDTKA